MSRLKCICLFILVLCCSLLNVDAQTERYNGILRYLNNAKVLDSANIRITYSLIYVPDSSKLNEKLNDRKILLIGNSIQHFYSYYSRFIDSVVTANSKNKKGGSSRLPNFPDKVWGEWYDIYNNYPAGKQTVIENISNFSMYVFNEDLADFPQWNITTETMTVLNHLCYKATCYYHGRVWEAWFTLDLPLNTGPWKLRGLPGLILKAYDSRQHYVFECIGIEKLKYPIPILMYEMAYPGASNPGTAAASAKTRESYLNALSRFYNNYVDTILSMGSDVSITDDSGKQIEYIESPNRKFADLGVGFAKTVNARDRYKKIPYNPIELE